MLPAPPLTDPDERISRIRFFTRKLRSRNSILVDDRRRSSGCRARMVRKRDHGCAAQARQRSEAAALAGHVHDPPLCHAEPGFTMGGFELCCGHLRFPFEGCMVDASPRQSARVPVRWPLRGAGRGQDPAFVALGRAGWAFDWRSAQPTASSSAARVSKAA